MKAGFLVKPQLEPAGEGFNVINAPAYRGSSGDVWVIAAPDGGPMPTDYASVPRIAVWLIPRFGKFTIAAIVHDWFCMFGILAGVISPVDADGVFRQILRIYKVTFLMRWLAWTGVRWGAAFNPIRRAGWWGEFPKMIPFTLLALLIMPLAVIGIVFGLVLFGGLQYVISLFLRDEETTTGVNATT